MKKLLPAIVLVLLSAFVAPTTAQARGPVDLHDVGFRNRTIPGSTCFSNDPIKLHHGHGKGGRRDHQRLYADMYGDPVYGDITGDGQDEAFLDVQCANGGGTAAGEYKSSWVVFSGGTGKVTTLGILEAQYQWLNTQPTQLETPKIHHQIAKVPEHIWFSTDPDCCGSALARTRWHYENGALTVTSSKIVRTDLIVSATKVGHAELGMTKADLKKAYGKIKSEELANGGCDIYWHGSAAKSFGALIDHSNSNKVFGIYAPDGAVTLAGVGTYTTVKQLKHAYAGHTIEEGSGPGGHQVFVKFSHSWIGFTLDESSSPATVAGMRIGSHAFVTGKHTCSS